MQRDSRDKICTSSARPKEARRRLLQPQPRVAPHGAVACPAAAVASGAARARLCSPPSLQRRHQGLEEDGEREEGDQPHGGRPGLCSGPVVGVVRSLHGQPAGGSRRVVRGAATGHAVDGHSTRLVPPAAAPRHDTARRAHASVCRTHCRREAAREERAREGRQDTEQVLCC